MQSCGSPIFKILTVEKPGFCELVGFTKTLEPGRFRCVTSVKCGEWQSVHPMSLRQCSPRRKLLCSSLPAWHERQVSATSFDDLFLNEMILAGSPSSECALPGP